jgi:TRAP-type C4-dicarboxylate transport system permease small subunit
LTVQSRLKDTLKEDRPSEENRAGERALWDRIISRFEDVGAILALTTMTVLYALAVSSRYITKISMPWADELVRFCFIWLIFLGASIGVRRGAHLGVAVVYSTLPAKWQKLFSISIAACCVFTCAMLAWKGMEMVHLQFKMGQRSSQLGVPIFLVGLSVPVGLLLCIFRFIQTLVAHLTRVLEDNP